MCICTRTPCNDERSTREGLQALPKDDKQKIGFYFVGLELIVLASSFVDTGQQGRDSKGMNVCKQK